MCARVVLGCSIRFCVSLCYGSSVPPFVDDQPSAFNTLAKYLQALYKRSPLPTKNKWPPTPSKYYINLACVSGETVSRHEMDEFTRSTIEGNIDSIYERKEHISIEDVACKVNERYPNLVLVEGAPGVGKTTFAWELCRGWADGRLLQHYSLVMLLRLRDKSIRQVKQLQDIFFHPNKSICEEVCEEVVSVNGKGILMILEGFDELPENLRKSDSFFCRLIEGELPLATILVTSRPWATSVIRSNFCNSVSQRIEILGFTKELIDEFLVSVTKEDTKLLNQMRQFLKLNPPIHAAMYVPLNAVTVFEICKEKWRNNSDTVVPTTITGLYTEFSKTILVRCLCSRNDGHRRLNRFTDLPQPIYERFCTLCKIAYDGIHNGGQLVFDDIPDGIEELGFMQSVTELYVTSGVSVSYNFIHLTVQEFLAAFYVSLQQETNYVIEHHMFYLSRSMYEVSRFLAGITELKCGVLKERLPTPNQDDITHDIPFNSADCNTMTMYTFTTNVAITKDHCNLLFESQNLSILEASLGCKVAFLHICDNENPMEYFAAGWCIGHSKCQWKLAFQGVVPPDCAEMLVLGVQQCKQPSPTLNICDLYIGEKVDRCGLDTLKTIFDLRHIVCFDLDRLFFSVHVHEQELSNPSNSLNALSILGNVVEECNNLKEVELYVSVHDFQKIIWQGDCFQPSKVMPESDLLQPCYHLLYAVLRLRSLRMLTLHKEICMCFTESALALLHASSLKSLKIVCSSAINSFEQLTSAISSCKSLRLKHLNFRINFNFEDYSVHVAELLVQRRPRLSSLCLQQCNLTDMTAVRTLQPLTSCDTALKTLNLAKNKLGEESCAVIATILNNTHLSVLDMSECDLPHSGIVSIIQALTVNTRLKKLNFSGNNCSGCAQHLEEMLCKNTTLAELKLVSCSFQKDESGKVLKLFAENKNTGLQTLAFSDNKFDNVEKSLVNTLIRDNRTLHYLSISLDHRDLQYFGPLLVSALALNGTLKQLAVTMECFDFNEDFKWLLSGCKDYHKVKKKLNIKAQLRTRNLMGNVMVIETVVSVPSPPGPVAATVDDQPQDPQQGK